MRDPGNKQISMSGPVHARLKAARDARAGELHRMVTFSEVLDRILDVYDQHNAPATGKAPRP